MGVGGWIFGGIVTVAGLALTGYAVYCGVDYYKAPGIIGLDKIHSVEATLVNTVNMSSETTPQERRLALEEGLPKLYEVWTSNPAERDDLTSILDGIEFIKDDPYMLNEPVMYDRNISFIIEELGDFAKQDRAAKKGQQDDMWAAGVMGLLVLGAGVFIGYEVGYKW